MRERGRERTSRASTRIRITRRTRMMRKRMRIEVILPKNKRKERVLAHLSYPRKRSSARFRAFSHSSQSLWRSEIPFGPPLCIPIILTILTAEGERREGE